MRTSLILLIVALTVSGEAQNSAQSWHEWNATISVADENGLPVPAATVSILYSILASDKTEHQKIIGTTDTNGMFAASHRDTGVSAIAFRAAKSGYYSITQGYDLGLTYSRDIGLQTFPLCSSGFVSR